MKIVARNKRAFYDYDISTKLVAGVVLTGAEVKSVKLGHVSLKGSFVTIKGAEAYLTNAHINPYKLAGPLASYDPKASRKLLLHRRQIGELSTSIQSQGMTVVPLVIGLERNLIKVELGIGKGKKLYDKRQNIKKRDMLRDVQREVKPGK